MPTCTARVRVHPAIRRTVAAAMAALVTCAGGASAFAQGSCLPPKITTVGAESYGVNSGIEVVGGEIVSISAKGTWTVLPGIVPKFGPNGTPRLCDYLDLGGPDTCPVRANWGALVAHIGPHMFLGNGVKFRNRYIDNDPEWTGEIYYKINDNIPNGNEGQMKVTTTVCYPATLYQEGYYTGEEIRITEDMSSLPLNFNDLVGSLRVAPGWKIQVFVDTNYGGGSKTFTKDTVDLSAMAGASCPGGHWASCISSVKVSPK